jgi:hypothetical protein
MIQIRLSLTLITVPLQRTLGYALKQLPGYARYFGVEWTLQSSVVTRYQKGHFHQRQPDEKKLNVSGYYASMVQV